MLGVIQPTPLAPFPRQPPAPGRVVAVARRPPAVSIAAAGSGSGSGSGSGTTLTACVCGSIVVVLLVLLFERDNVPPPPPSPPSPPLPPSPPAASTGFFLAVDGRPDLDSTASVVVAACGAADEGAPDARCLSADAETAGVRCCASAGSALAPRSSCCDAYECAAGATPPCACPEWGDGFTRCLKTSHAEAEARCAALGLELCASTQVLAGEVSGTGCHLDFALVWTRTPCTPTMAEMLMSLAKLRARDGGEAVCLDTCPLAHNGRCEDGGPGAHRGVERDSEGVIDFQTCAGSNRGYCCELGSDCTDCGPR